MAVAAALALAAGSAFATPAQGYAFVLTPLAHHGTHWLLLHGAELSDPNTAAAAEVLPSMRRERAWWVVVDHRGHPRCSLPVASADPPPRDLLANTDAAPRVSLMARLRKGCSALAPPAAAWLANIEPAAVARWSAGEVCVGSQCVAARAEQRSLQGARSRPAADAAPAPARCVAGRWLIVSNSAADGGTRVEGARFAKLPPAVRNDIVGYEAVRIDGVAVVPAALRCP